MRQGCSRMLKRKGLRIICLRIAQSFGAIRNTDYFDSELDSYNMSITTSLLLSVSLCFYLVPLGYRIKLINSL